MRQRALPLTLVLLGLVVSTASAQQPTADALVGGFVSAWNAHDMGGLGAVFVDDADWVTASGLRLAGIEAIRAFLVGEHASWARTTQMNASNRTVRSISAGVAVIHFDWQISGALDPQGKPVEPSRGVNMFVAVRSSDGWRVVAGQVTRARPAA